ncbi:MAG: hypothetical protein GF416_00490 [Candidatus Altiarchaeales archaeon]|nr:hypothetical protein [Candidatus Altiarchaeales archaeon]MBD3415596.1 hypothetical protein [Candidatus Altiarchaeales archaeon]
MFESDTMTRYTRPHVGHLAGVVYRALERDQPLSVLDLSLKTGLWPWDVLLALGWLSCEDKVKFRRNLAALMVEIKRR